MKSSVTQKEYEFFQNSDEKDILEFIKKRKMQNANIIYDFDNTKIGILIGKNTIIDLEEDFDIIKKFYKYKNKEGVL